VLGEVAQGDSVKDVFERDGFLVFDPGIPEKTIDRAVADVELG
jgi:hypothetical protein